MRAETTSHEPTLSKVQACSLLLAYCLIYVLPLHIYRPARASPERSRDDPIAIRARIRAVSVSTAACSCVTFVLLSTYAAPWRLMGYWPCGLQETVQILCLTATLFAAPLYEYIIIDGAWSEWLHLRPLRLLQHDWPTWRNLVAGPITEECLFRSASVPLLLAAGYSISATIFLSPLVFGLAHIHHFYEFRKTNPGVHVGAAVARSVLQFSYTYLFGVYATFIFLRTGSTLAAIAAHAFCNSMGLPRVWGSVEPYWLLEGAPAHLQGEEQKLWTVGYYVLLFGGMAAFYCALFPLSVSDLALESF
ncbi:uncharacterized protein F5Z01DRAFT_181641 [Emericellopsis atlantica]|uniref:intramembrane prenyl-peptidase Rce1 n=1 Tax=Emericellopsis atlantica TaxID=2614577 RepID=A0A9P7ZJH3_9HYPO|nr:uncharacterized protein F5Z01DRAFT_181641 [Emericellopsis atlantica]KAG9252755.1 hypothetical protein F5Z01DRAFT_181641 [Emericellopsis atlantica]